MSLTLVTREINADPASVFRTVAEPEQFARAVPAIVRTEFLGPVKSGVGTRFRSVRMNKGKEQPFDMEVTEVVPGQRIRIVNITHGTVWDSLFTVTGTGRQAVLEVAMEARTPNPLMKLMLFLNRAMIHRMLANDIDQVKAFCEKQ